VSCCTETEELARRLHDAGDLLASRFGTENVSAMRVEEEGSWSYPQGREEAISHVVGELTRELCHA
ncbi:MAG TPA: hypothetical protein VMD30_00290, partial [Tepidisphaeraceae bacterium]|nr:hypothetical protein [Tepidisphaeraceae bacterium]